MTQMNWKTGVVSLIAAIGILFEIFKSAPGTSLNKFWEKENLPGFSSISVPVSVRSIIGGMATTFAKKQTPKPPIAKRMNVAASHPIRKTTTPQMPNIEGQVQKFIDANKAQTTDSNPEEKGGEGVEDKDEKKAEIEYEYFFDKKTGKIYRRKKKKAAEEDPKATEVAKKEPSAPPAEEPSDLATVVQHTIVNQVIRKTPENEKEAMLDEQEWIRRLLSQPDLKMTQLFVQQYQANLVSTVVYYKIVNMMIEDSRVDMRQLGVMAAGLTPSMMSFKALAHLQTTEPIGTKLRLAVDSAMNQYTELSNLTTLSKILRSQTQYEVIMASQMIDKAAQLHLRSSNTTAAAVATSATPARPKNASHFSLVVSALEPLTKSPDSMVASQTTATLNNLNQLLGTTTEIGTSDLSSTNSTLATTQGL